MNIVGRDQQALDDMFKDLSRRQREVLKQQGFPFQELAVFSNLLFVSCCCLRLFHGRIKDCCGVSEFKTVTIEFKKSS